MVGGFSPTRMKVSTTEGNLLSLIGENDDEDNEFELSVKSEPDSSINYKKSSIHLGNDINLM